MKILGTLFTLALFILAVVLLALLTKNEGNWAGMWADFIQLITTGTVS